MSENNFTKVEQAEFKKSKPAKKLFVSNIDYSVNENILTNHFSKYGQVSKCKIIRNGITNKSKV